MIKPPGKIVGGEISLDGTDLLTLSDAEMRQTRLAVIALVAQGAMNSLNPVMRVGDQILDALHDHGVRRLAARSSPTASARCSSWSGCRAGRRTSYPHELSGGMKQRVCIALAISLKPQLIIADEPTSALDVVVQRQVMETLGRSRSDLGAAVILIGHDMGLMAQFVDRLGGDVRRRAGRDQPGATRCTPSRCTPTPSCSSRACRRSNGKGCSKAYPGCRRRCSTRPRAARSTRAART